MLANDHIDRDPLGSHGVLNVLLRLVPLLLMLLPNKVFASNDEYPATHTTIKPLEEQALHIDGEDRTFWGLNETEWQRYLQLMKGPQGRWTPNEDPTLILGLNATNDKDRMRYAKLQVAIEKKRTEQALKFTLAVTEAWRDMYPNMPVIDEKKLRAYNRKHSLPIAIPPESINQEFDLGADVLPGDRFVVFIDPGCTACKANVLTLLKKILPVNGAGIDLYFLQMSDDDIIKWAVSQALPQSLVGSNKTITLNKGDKGLLQLLAVAHQQQPSTYYRRRGKNYQPIAL